MRISSFIVRVCAVFSLATIVLMPVHLIDAQGGAQPIQSRKSVTGTIKGTPAAYTLDGKKGDVFQINAALSTSQTNAKDGNVISSTLTLADSTNKQVATSSSGTTSSSTSNGKTTSTNSVILFAILPADGTYTLSLMQSNDAKLPADFTLNALNIPVIKVGDTIKNKLAAKDLPQEGSALIYAMQSDSDFILNYRLTGGDFMPSLQVQRIIEPSTSDSSTISFSTSSSPLEVVGAILGPKLVFDLVKPAMKGGSLVVNGSPKPYFITVANNMDGYDATSFNSSKSPDAFSEFEISITQP